MKHLTMKLPYYTVLIAVIFSLSSQFNIQALANTTEPAKTIASIEENVTASTEGSKNYQNKALFIDDYRSSVHVRYDLLRAETQEINAIMFIFREDLAGLSHLAELRKAARRGVKVRLIFDDYGATGAKSARRLSPEMVKHLMDEGIEIKIFHRIDRRAFLQPSRYLNRNHEKILHLKSQNSFLIGDRNWSKTYFGFEKDGNDKFLSRDLFVMGPETKAVEDHFDSLFNSSAVEKMTFKDPLDSSAVQKAKNQLDSFEAGMEKRKFLVKSPGAESWKKQAKPVKQLTFIGDKVNGPLGSAQKKLFELIKNSKSNVVIESPYVILNQQSMEAIMKAKKNGSQIEIITNSGDLTDEKWVPPAADHDLRKLEKAGVPVYENIENRIFHTKSYVVDDRYSIFGSNNFDNRSLRWDREAAVLIDDTEFTKTLKDMIQRDKKFTKRFDTTQPTFRSRDCIRWGLSQLLRPVL